MQKNASLLTREKVEVWTSTKVAFMTQKSAIQGGIVGEIAGAILGTITGSLTGDLTGTLIGFTAGVVLGALAGILVGMVVGKTAGSSGGPSIGAYSGMGFGALLGMLIGIFAPNSVRLSPLLINAPVLETLASSRFEAVAFFAFTFCILGTAIGVWVAGINYRRPTN